MSPHRIATGDHQASRKMPETADRPAEAVVEEEGSTVVIGPRAQARIAPHEELLVGLQGA